MNAVTDQLDGDPVVLEQGDDGPGIAVMHWPHGVEQVCSIVTPAAIARTVVS